MSAPKKPAKLPDGLTLRRVFEGVPRKGLALLAAIAEKQDREFYKAHKEDFRALCVEPMEALVGELRHRLAPEFPGLALPPPKLFRLHRDVRFGADKRPFKDHLSGMVVVAPGPAVTEAPVALYVQLGPDAFCAAGVYGLDGPELSAYRDALLDERRGRELDRILAKLAEEGVEVGARETLKKVPAGLDPAHPRAALLRGKGLIVRWKKLPARLQSSPELLPYLEARARAAAPLVRWLVRNTASSSES